MSSDSISVERIKGLTNNGSNGSNYGDDIPAEPHFVHSKTVPAKYLGSVVDRREMTLLGKEQVLRVRLNQKIPIWG